MTNRLLFISVKSMCLTAKMANTSKICRKLLYKLFQIIFRGIEEIQMRLKCDLDGSGLLSRSIFQYIQIHIQQTSREAHVHNMNFT